MFRNQSYRKNRYLRRFNKLNTKTIAGEKTYEVTSPGQIFLFGEHAVVYGEPALAAAINIRTKARSEANENKRFRVFSERIGRLEGKVKKENGTWKIIDREGDLEELNFVTKAAEITLNYVKKGEGIDLEIESKLPSGSGLGSSSAVTTATIASVSLALEERLNRKEISQLAFDTEVAIQGAASKTGVNVASYGGFLKIERNEMERLRTAPELKIVIGYTGKYGNTGELVRKVKKLKESRPKIIEPIIETIGKCTESGINSLRKSDLQKVGALMNANQNLLEGLQVSSPELRKLIKSARASGALGAKLTGSGGGGCMIALGSGKINKISKAIKDAGGHPIETKIGVEGLRY